MKFITGSIKALFQYALYFWQRAIVGISHTFWPTDTIIFSSSYFNWAVALWVVLKKQMIFACCPLRNSYVRNQAVKIVTIVFLMGTEKLLGPPLASIGLQTLAGGLHILKIIQYKHSRFLRRKYTTKKSWKYLVTQLHTCHNCLNNVPITPNRP